MSITNFPMQIFPENKMVQHYVHDVLIKSFIEQRRFKVIERTEFEEVLKELKLSQTELVDSSAALEVGKLLGVEGIIIGTIYVIEDSFEIFARLIDTETGLVMSENDIFCEENNFQTLKN